MLIQEGEHHLPPLASDAALAKLSLQGDQHAFELLHQRYQDAVFHLSEQMVKDADLAADISQEVFTRFLLALPTMKDSVPFKGWLFQVARHCSIDALRRRRRQARPFSSLEGKHREEESSLLENIADSLPLPDEEAEARERQHILCRAIRNLPPKFRTIVALRYVFGMPYREISRRLGIPESTAKTYFWRARVHLQRALKPYLDTM